MQFGPGLRRERFLFLEVQVGRMVKSQSERDTRGLEWLRPSLQEDDFDATGFSPIVERILTGSRSEQIQLRFLVNDMSNQLIHLPEIINKVIITKVEIASAIGAQAVSAVLLNPVKQASENTGAIFYIHSGGLCTGTADSELITMSDWVAELGCLLISANFRMPPEAPYPAALDDLHTVFDWLLHNTESLNIDPTRIVVTGSSSGGLLAAGLSQRLKDTHRQQFCAQILQFPLLDDRAEQSSSNICFENVWLPGTEHLMWKAWLGDLFGKAIIPPEAVPGRVKNSSGLPPTFVHIAELDHGRDDCLAYAQGLLKAGIFVDLHLWGGAYHAFDQLQPEADLSRRYHEMIIQQLREALTGKLTRKFL